MPDLGRLRKEVCGNGKAAGGSQTRKYGYHCGPKPGAALRSAFSQAIEPSEGAIAREPEATHLDPVLLLLPLLSLIFNLNDFQLQLLLLQ